MCLLFESIAVVQGKLQNLQWHEHRMNHSRLALLGLTQPLTLQNLAFSLPKEEGLLKLKVVYAQEIQEITWQKYQAKQIQSFQLVHSSLSYPHKFVDRGELQRLYTERKEADEIIIVQNGLITDSSIANLLFLAKGKWFTPATPLLKGTMRANLLQAGRIKEADITIEALPLYEKVLVINALNPFDANKALPISSIRA